MFAFSKVRLLPANNALGWTPYAWLAFFPIFFVVPALGRTPAWLWMAHVAGAALLLTSYFRSFWVTGRELRGHVVLQGTLAALFTPSNPGACVLFTYAACTGARAESAREGATWISVVTVAGLVVGYVAHIAAMAWIGQSLFTALIGAVCLQRAQVDRTSARLRVANEEIERLAAVAERERIARDLHDVLGHTLSLIVLKSELASRLAERDPARAAREIRDVETVSRNALEEVREAVRGYRATMDEELARARYLLDAGGISLVVDQTADLAVLHHEQVEEVLARALREAVTNVVRHSRAHRATIRLSPLSCGDAIQLDVVDDGIGDRAGTRREGNGLRGMRERIEALNGTLTIDATHTGTRVSVVLRCPATGPATVPLRVLQA